VSVSELLIFFDDSGYVSPELPKNVVYAFSSLFVVCYVHCHFLIKYFW